MTCQRGRCQDRPSATSCAGGPCRVFITSTTHSSNLGGLDGADDICQDSAEAAELPGTYRAWLADQTGSPAARFTKSPRPYVLVDQAATRIADDWDDLTSGQLLAPILVSEHGATLPDGYVWTNTLADGTPEDDADDVHCDNWTSVNLTTTGNVGESLRTNELWTNSGHASGCNSTLRLYCFQQ